MRIVLDVADDVLEAVEQRAQRERKTIGEVLSELTRPALTRPHSAVAVLEPRVALRSVNVRSPRPVG
jgi:hypothetical protein